MINETNMVPIFHALVHLVLAAAALCELVLISVVIWHFTRRVQERIMRSCAAVSGILLYLGAKALGLSIPMFLVQILAQGVSYTTGVFGVLFPSMTGLLVAWYVVRYFNSKDERRNIVGMRILALVMTVVFFLYTDAYIATFDVAKHEDFRLLLPNLTFVLTVLLYAIFKYHPLDEPELATVAAPVGPTLESEPTQAPFKVRPRSVA